MMKVRGLRFKKSGIEFDIYYPQGGKRYKVTLPLDHARTSNVNAASEIRNAVKTAIYMEHIGRAKTPAIDVIREHFPDFAIEENKNDNTLLSWLFDDYIDKQAITRAKSVIRDLRQYAKNFNAVWPGLRAKDLTIAMIYHYIESCQKNGLFLKTIRNRFVLLRGALDNAEDIYQMIDFNPVMKIKWRRLIPSENERIKRSNSTITPFTFAEILRLFAVASDTTNNMIAVAFALGLRLNELFALAWEDIDLVAGTVHVQRGYVYHNLTTLKTKKSNAVIKLDQFPQVRCALLDQKNHTFMHQAIDCGIYGKLHFVFHNPKTNKPFTDSDEFLDQIWMPLLRKATVIYRGPKQMRHTFAIHRRINGDPDIWIAKILRHTTTEMLARHYGKELPPNAAEMGFGTPGALDAFWKTVCEDLYGTSTKPRLAASKP